MRAHHWLLVLVCLAGASLSSCAVSSKLSANRFESSEVYGKTGLRVRGGYKGQNNVVLTNDYTLTAPNSQSPNIEPTHNVVFGGGLGISDRFEANLTTDMRATGKFQVLGAPKIMASDGNLSLSILATISSRKTEKEGSSVLSTQRYRVEIDTTSYGAGTLIGYRLDKNLNLYMGPFAEFGRYDGEYDVIGVSTSTFEGKTRTRGGVVGLEIGGPSVTLITEGAWSKTNSGNSQRSFWVAGADLVLGF